MGITMFDPTPPYPESGLGFASSPNTETIVPVDPTFALALAPGQPTWNDVEITAADVAEVNLRAYAWSVDCYYGASHNRARAAGAARAVCSAVGADLGHRVRGRPEDGRDAVRRARADRHGAAAVRRPAGRVRGNEAVPRLTRARRSTIALLRREVTAYRRPLRGPLIAIHARDTARG
jgi:hypothetical protein